MLDRLKFPTRVDNLRIILTVTALTHSRWIRGNNADKGLAFSVG